MNQIYYKLTCFLLNYYISTERRRLDELNRHMSDVFFSRSEITQEEYEDGLISQDERDSENAELDHEMARWDDLMSDRRWERKQYEDLLRVLINQKGKIKYARAA